jgi:glycosyltransferase involved in cell wall biosynthesis
LAYRSEAVSAKETDMILAVCFTNFGPYHLARLRALATRLQQSGDCLIAYEVASSERTYPWLRRQESEPFDWITLFPDRVLESLSPSECARAMTKALNRDLPDVLGIVGYARPESVAAAHWARRHGQTAILLSESQAIERRRVWWKELVKVRRVRLFDAALVGGARHHEYLRTLGMPADRIALGYNAVDNAYYQSSALAWRDHPEGRQGLPEAPFFLSVCRFVPEKNLLHLVKAFSLYRDQAVPGEGWHLVLCGDGPEASSIDAAIAQSGHADAIHRPGFLQADSLSRLFAFASAFVLPSLSEPWGLVANEAASTALPLLVSERAGCVTTLVPEPQGTTGARFDPLVIEEITQKLTWMTQLTSEDRQAMGQRAAEVVDQWGPDRFAQGMLEALDLAAGRRNASARVILERAS